MLLFVVGYILVRGVPALTPDLFQWEYTSENVSLLPALASTVVMALLALALAVPVGVGAAIYLVEYARRGSRFVRLVRDRRNAAGHSLHHLRPVRHAVLRDGLRLGPPLLSGACTWPSWCCRSSCAPPKRRSWQCPIPTARGGFGLGAGRLRTVARCVLPSGGARYPGRRHFGPRPLRGRGGGPVVHRRHQAPNPRLRGQGIFALFDSTRTLAVHMYTLACEGPARERGLRHLGGAADPRSVERRHARGGTENGSEQRTNALF